MAFSRALPFIAPRQASAMARSSCASPTKSSICSCRLRNILFEMCVFSLRKVRLLIASSILLVELKSNEAFHLLIFSMGLTRDCLSKFFLIRFSASSINPFRSSCDSCDCLSIGWLKFPIACLELSESLIASLSRSALIQQPRQPSKGTWFSSLGISLRLGAANSLCFSFHR